MDTEGIQKLVAALRMVREHDGVKDRLAWKLCEEAADAIDELWQDHLDLLRDTG